MSSASRFSRIRIDTNVNREFGTLGSPIQLDGDGSTLGKSGIPSLLLSQSGYGDEDKPMPHTQISGPNPKAKHEMRKLLTHVLVQLVNRRKPPSISDTIQEVGKDATEHGVAAFTDVFKDVAKIGKAIQRTSSKSPTPAEEDEEDEDPQSYTTEATFDLLLQLKDIMAMSIKQGWHIFGEDPFYQETPTQREDKGSSLLRRSRQSFQPSAKRTRSSSPSGRQQIHVPELLSLCIAVLSSIISEDCRFQIISPRPSRPPNALQALSLTVAQFLIHTHRRDPKVISRIGFAVIPAFSTFQPEMHGRLISFFEISVIRGILESLRRSQGFSDVETSLMMSPIERVDSTPIVSIQIDEVQEQPCGEASGLSVKVQSSGAPHQDASIYYLSSLIAPLMAAILETVDVGALDGAHELFVRFSQLLDVVSNLKVDSYNDFLAIVAYHTARSRKQACAILCTLWPKIVGHATIGRSLSIPLNLEWKRFPHTMSSSFTHNKHQFIPWQFIHRSRWPETTPQHPCTTCSKSIHDFGLLCPFCMCAVHFDCYDPPEGSLFLEYRMASDAAVRKVAMYKFSYLLPSRDSGDPMLIPKQHTFKAINLFTLCPCHVCFQPLWGAVAQAVKCTECSLIAHPACLSTPSLSRCGILDPTSDQMTIDIKTLRRSAVNHFTELRWTYNHLSMLSYEEVMVIYDTLRTQIALLDSGIALGSIIVMQQGDSASHVQLEEFELHRSVGWCKELLLSQGLPKSGATIDYMEENKLESLEHSMLYDFSNLVYLATAMKSPISAQTSNIMASSDLLNVHNFDTVEAVSESTAHPYEAVPLSHLRDILHVEFNVHAPSVIKVLLNHLHHISFFERLDSEPTPFVDTMGDDSTICVFPLPLGLDLSTDVETLVTAVEVCLSDLDLSVNEFAFLLLIRRFWPNGLMSDYGLRRLTKSILSWIIAEDDSLATILRDYIAKQQPLPGVRRPLDEPPWPASRFPPRSGAESQASSGRDYVQARRALLARYAEPWLLSLHNQDPDEYVDIVYDACVELAEDRTTGSVNYDTSSLVDPLETKSPTRLNEVLYCISKVSHASIAFTALNRLILRWLLMTNDHALDNTSITGLHRVFPKDLDSSGRTSIYDSEQAQADDVLSALATDSPFQSLIEHASQSEAALNRALQWLLMISRSGIELPPQILEHFLNLLNGYPSNLTNAQIYIHTVMISFWLKSLGRQSMQSLISRLFSSFEPAIIAAFKGADKSLSETSMNVFRRSLAACSLIYGCDRPTILELQLITEQEVRDLPSRRKLVARASNVVDPIMIEPAILKTIGHCLRLDIPVVTSHIAKFMHLFVTHSPLIAPYEVDNFILRNSELVSKCAWKFYGVEKHGIDAIRPEFLLRVLAVDSESFHGIVEAGLDPDIYWERRLRTVNRLTRILNDVASPSFYVDGRQWRPTVADVFSCFFSLLWKDAQEEVRLSVRTVCTGLLPAQLDAISQCWNEALPKSPMKDKIKLVAFLLQLRPHFPGWTLITWETLIETMVEFHYDAPNDASEMRAMQSSYLSQATPDMAHLVVSILLLAMSMLSDGMGVDTFSLLKVKVQLVKILGFSDISVVPMQDFGSFQIHYGNATGIPDIAFPCLEYLVPLVDAPHTVDIPSTILGLSNEQGTSTTVNVLVGYIFVDIIFNLLGTLEKLESLPVLSLKSLLESVYIILHKHDFEAFPARVLQPLLRKSVPRVLELVSKNINYEIRQLALTVTQAFLKRCVTFLGAIIPVVLEEVTELIVPFAATHQDPLITQGRALILGTLTSHASSGLLAGLFRRPLKPSFFTAVKQVLEADATADPFVDPLSATLLRDTFLRAADSDSSTMQNVVNNLHSFVQLYHENYSYDLATFCGQQAASIMRRLSDHLFDFVDSSPLLLMLALLIQGNKKYLRELLLSTDTCLRIALTRGQITSDCLTKLIKATQPKILKQADATLGKVLSTLLEIMAEALRMKSRVLPSTLNAIIQSLMSDEINVFPEDPDARFKLLMANMVENAAYFLDHHSWVDGQSDSDFNVSISVAKVVLQTLELDPTNKQRSTYQDAEVAYRLVGSTRSWVVLGIAALQDPNRKWPTILFQHLPAFIHSYIATMRPYAQSNMTSDVATTDLNHGYIAIKVWLMLAQQTSTSTKTGEACMMRVWNELWPMFDSILSALEVEARAGLSSTLMILASTSVTDLFFFLRTLHAPIALDLISHAEILKRLKNGAGESSHLKLNRTARGVFDATIETSFEVLVQQTTKELIATEKLRIAESGRREFGKTGMDKYWG